jgi:hypothetical protein
MHLTPERQAAARRLARRPTHSLIVRPRPKGLRPGTSEPRSELASALEDYEAEVRGPRLITKGLKIGGIDRADKLACPRRHELA